MTQRIFSPTNYGFKFTSDWYEFDSTSAHKQALAARNKLAKDLRAKGCKVSCFSLPDQLVSQGGIGSGHPHIEAVVTCYGLNVFYGVNIDRVLA